MPVYEYECPKCGRYERYKKHLGPISGDDCPTCGSVAERRFSIPSLRTDTNNPLRNLGKILRADTTTRSGAEMALQANGLVMVDEKDVDDCQRRAARKRRELDEQIEKSKATYARLPEDVKAIDGKKAIAQAEAAASRVTSAKLVRA